MVNKVCNFLSSLLLIILAITASVFILPIFFGCKNMVVVSGSMEPSVPVGSVVIVKPIKEDTLQVGDVITYKMAGQLSGKNITHRVVRIEEEKRHVITKGDANKTEDVQPVLYENIVGKMLFHIPILGFISIYIKTPIGIAGVCILVMIMIILHFLPEMFKDTKNEEQ